MSMDTAAWLTAISFAVQIAAGVAPMKWPQHAWMAGVIFWLSLAFALVCSAWWILSNQETMMAVIRSGYSVAALLVALAGVVTWMQWRAGDVLPQVTQGPSDNKDGPRSTFDASSEGSISANKMQMDGPFPGTLAKASTGGKIILDGSRFEGLQPQRTRVDYPQPDPKYASLSNAELNKLILSSVEEFKNGKNREDWTKAALKARDFCAAAFPKTGTVRSVGPGSQLLLMIYILDRESADQVVSFLETVSKALVAEKK